MGVSRRTFLKRAAGALLAPAIVPASALGRGTRPAPSNRIAVGFVGCGMKGWGNVSEFITRPEVQVVALCDVDPRHLDAVRHIVTEAYGSDCFHTADFREVTRRDDVDAVVISTPDHWHVIPALDAVRHGKDCYVEKPLTLTIAEGRTLADEVVRYGRVLQTGSHQRSMGQFRFMCELVRNGHLGRLRSIEVEIPTNNIVNPVGWGPEPLPEGFDYDMWLGPAPWAPFHPRRCHYSFRYLLDYSGGQVTNWGAHYLDIAQWALDRDTSGPVEVEGNGVFPRSGLFNTATSVNFTCLYDNGVRVTCRTREDDIYDGSIRFEGTEGSLFATRDRFESEPAGILEHRTLPEEIRLPRSYDHIGNFLECIRTRREPVAGAEIGHRSATVCHLGNLAMKLGRKLQWDPRTESFPGDEEANALRSRVLRSPWRV